MGLSSKIIGFTLILLTCWGINIPGYSQKIEVDSTLLNQGIAAFETQQYAEAETLLRQIIDSDSKQAEAHYFLALVHEKTGDFKAADRAIVRALEIQPNEVRYLQVQLRLGFPRDGIASFRRMKRHDLALKILKIDTSNALAHLQLGIEQALIYTNQRNRITIPQLRPYQTTLLGIEDGNVSDMDELRESPGEYTLPQIPDPFDIEAVKLRGYTVRDLSFRAKKAYPQAVEHLTTALAADPTLRAGYTPLMALYTAHQDHMAMLTVAHEMHRHFPDDPYTWLFLGYASYKLDQFEQADRFFHQALDLMSPELHSVFTDIRRVLNEKQIEGLSEKALTAENFWTNKDPRYLTYYNEREIEHYARLAYTKLLFSEPKLDLEGWDSDRGKVYVRYGMPEKDFFMTNMVADCGEREGTLYMNAITNFHVFDYGAFRFVFGNPGNFGGPDQASNTSIPPLNEFPLYSPCTHVLAFIDEVQFDMDYITRSKDIIRKIPDRFAFAPTSTHINFPFNFSVFKGIAGKSDVYVAFGVPLATQVSKGQNLNLGLQTGTFLISEREGRVAESRYAVGGISFQEQMSFGASSLWIGTHRLAARPGEYSLAVEFEAMNQQIMELQRSHIELPKYQDSKLMLSDLLLAYRIEDAEDESEHPGHLLRNELFIQPAPWGVYSVKQPVYFYFEVYNLLLNDAGQTRYRVEAALSEKREETGLKNLVQRIFRGEVRDAVSVAFEYKDTPTDDGQYLILDASEQKPGDYVLAVRVTDLVRDVMVESSRSISLEQ